MLWYPPESVLGRESVRERTLTLDQHVVRIRDDLTTYGTYGGSIRT